MLSRPRNALAETIRVLLQKTSKNSEFSATAPPAQMLRVAGEERVRLPESIRPDMGTPRESVEERELELVELHGAHAPDAREITVVERLVAENLLRYCDRGEEQPVGAPVAIGNLGLRLLDQRERVHELPGFQVRKRQESGLNVLRDTVTREATRRENAALCPGGLVCHGCEGRDGRLHGHDLWRVGLWLALVVPRRR